MTIAIQWSAEFQTGIAALDRQNQRLFDYLDRVNRAIRQQDARKIEPIVHELIDYAISHNAFEETLLQEANYPLLQPHRAQHQSFELRIHSRLLSLHQGEDPLRIARDLRTDLALWLTNHIRHDDQDYVPCVQRKLNASRLPRLLRQWLG